MKEFDFFKHQWILLTLVSYNLSFGHDYDMFRCRQMQEVMESHFKHFKSPIERDLFMGLLLSMVQSLKLWNKRETGTSDCEKSSLATLSRKVEETCPWQEGQP